MKTRREVLRRGLFDRLVETRTSETVSEAKDIIDEANKASITELDRNLTLMRDVAEWALKSRGGTAAALGAEVLEHLRVIVTHRRRRNIDGAILEAIMATQRWMELRVNERYEKPVRAREKQLAALPNTRKATDAQIRDALAKNRKLADVAAELDLSERQLRTRRKQLRP